MIENTCENWLNGETKNFTDEDVRKNIISREEYSKINTVRAEAFKKSCEIFGVMAYDLPKTFCPFHMLVDNIKKQQYKIFKEETIDEEINKINQLEKDFVECNIENIEKMNRISYDSDTNIRMMEPDIYHDFPAPEYFLKDCLQLAKTNNLEFASTFFSGEDCKETFDTYELLINNELEKVYEELKGGRLFYFGDYFETNFFQVRFPDIKYPNYYYYIHKAGEIVTYKKYLLELKAGKYKIPEIPIKARKEAWGIFLWMAFKNEKIELDLTRGKSVFNKNRVKELRKEFNDKNLYHPFLYAVDMNNEIQNNKRNIDKFKSDIDNWDDAKELYKYYFNEHPNF